MSTPAIEVTWEEDHHDDDLQEEVSELEQVKERLAFAEENLRMLSEGVRMIASQLGSHHHQQQHQQNQVDSATGAATHKRIQRTDSDDNVTHATAEETILSVEVGESFSFQDSVTKSTSFLMEHDSQLSEILATERMAPMPAADLLALQNAAQMVKDHVRLSSAEAAIAVQDTIQAQRAARDWQSRALTAESELKFAKKQVHHLSKQNQKLSQERKVLVKEVRKVRRELAEDKQQDMWGQLEGYVAQALSIHEHQLKQQPSLSSPSITPSTSECHDGENKAAISYNNKAAGPPISSALGSIGNVLGFGPKSPPRNRLAGSRAPRQSPKPNRSSGTSGNDDGVNEKMVAIEDQKSFDSNRPALSPVTFVESPNASSETPPPNVVDPHVLRSLALPAVTTDC